MTGRLHFNFRSGRSSEHSGGQFLVKGLRIKGNKQNKRKRILATWWWVLCREIFILDCAVLTCMINLVYDHLNLDFILS